MAENKQTTPNPPKYGVVTNCGSLNMRKGRSTDTEIITVIPVDMKVRIISHKDGWYRVEYVGEKKFAGYCMEEYIKEI